MSQRLFTLVSASINAAAISVCLMSPNTAHAQATPADQYKQMGSLGALTEVCYGSKLIPQAVNNSLKQYAAQGASQTEIAKGLFASYNEAYGIAAQNHKIWNGTQQIYGPKTFNCTIQADIDMLKKFEQMILQYLK